MLPKLAPENIVNTAFGKIMKIVRASLNLLSTKYCRTHVHACTH